MFDELNNGFFILVIQGIQGSGKTSMVRYLMNTISWDEILVVSEECEDGEYSYLPEANKCSSLDRNKLDAIRVKDDRIKLIVFDDVLSMNMLQHHNRIYLEGWLTNIRKKNMRIIISTQLTTGIPTVFRKSMTACLVSQLDDNCVKMIKESFGRRVTQILLPSFTFLYITKKGTFKYIKLS